MQWKKKYTVVIVVVVIIMAIAFWPSNNRYLKKLHKEKDINGL